MVLIDDDLGPCTTSYKPTSDEVYRRRPLPAMPVLRRTTRHRRRKMEDGTLGLPNRTLTLPKIDLDAQLSNAPYRDGHGGGRPQITELASTRPWLPISLSNSTQPQLSTSEGPLVRTEKADASFLICPSPR